jgi:hypothetical protein
LAMAAQRGQSFSTLPLAEAAKVLAGHAHRACTASRPEWSTGAAGRRCRRSAFPRKMAWWLQGGAWGRANRGSYALFLAQSHVRRDAEKRLGKAGNGAQRRPSSSNRCSTAAPPRVTVEKHAPKSGLAHQKHLLNLSPTFNLASAPGRTHSHYYARICLER